MKGNAMSPLPQQQHRRKDRWTAAGSDQLNMDDLSIASDAISCSDTALLDDDGDDFAEAMEDFSGKAPLSCEAHIGLSSLPRSLLSHLNVSLPVAPLELCPPRLVIWSHPQADAATRRVVRLPHNPKAAVPKLATTKASIKRPRAHSSMCGQDDALHRACCKPQVTLQDIEAILCRQPAAASSSCTVTTAVSVCNPRLRKVERLVQRQPFSYPLHLAIYHKAPFRVVQRLVQADRSVLGVLDGANRETPLALLLRISPHDTQTFALLLNTHPEAVALKDRYDSTPLHVACWKGAPLEIVSRLCSLHPRAVHSCNFHGKTPLELAQQMTAHCSDEVALFLLDLSTSLHSPTTTRLQSDW